MGRRTGPALTAAALLALAGCGTGTGETDSESVRSTDAEVLACTELVAEGTVLRVTPGRDRTGCRCGWRWTATSRGSEQTAG